MTKVIDIKPGVIQNVFVANIIMDDYNVNGTPIVFEITARRADGIEKTETFIYPNADSEGTASGELFVQFFEVSPHAISQIVSVYINNSPIGVSFSEMTINGTTVTARYSDSVFSVISAINKDRVEMDFDVLNILDPKKFIVSDSSSWGMLSTRPAIIEIMIPGFPDVRTFYLGKNQLNIYASPIFGLNKPDCDPYEMHDLPDGIYTVKITGSPDTFSLEKKFLKTDLMRLRIDRLRIRASIDMYSIDSLMMKKVNEIEDMLFFAESNMRCGNTDTADEFLCLASDMIEEALNCINC